MRTLAVDFDGVIHTYERGWADGSIYGDLMPGAMTALMTLLARRDLAVFVHTTRDPGPVARWIERKSGHNIECLTYAGWRTLFWRRHTFWDMPGLLLVTNRKLPAFAYLDDRAVRFHSWDSAMSALDGDQP